MTPSKKQFTTVDEYIATFPPDVQDVLKKIRHTIQSVVPEATETISYGIPAFNVRGSYVVYFAGWKQHVSLYPVPSGDKAFRKEVAPYVGGKGTIRFLLTVPIPYELIKSIVLFRMKEIGL